MTFAIGPFQDIVDCDVSPLDCSDMILGLPYQQQCRALYDAQRNTYTLFKEKKAYKLTAATIPPPRPGAVQQLSLHKCLSLHVLPPVAMPPPVTLSPLFISPRPKPTSIPLSMSQPRPMYEGRR
jgi:hypothetical protein